MSTRTQRSTRWTRALALLAALAAMTSLAATGVPPATAAETEAAAPGTMTNSWYFWPVPGSEADFEAGVKAHAAWRKAANEGWTWRVYQPVVGKDMDHYVIRAIQLHWADLDANAAWEQASGALAKYMEQMGGSVARVEHFLGEWDTKHSKWEQRDDYLYFGVSKMKVRPGAYGDLLQELAKVHKAATERNWPKSYGIEWRIGGSSAMLLIFPATSFADMAEPDPPFIKYLADSLPGGMEAAAATMKALGGSFESDNYTIYRYRPDLSTPE